MKDYIADEYMDIGPTLRRFRKERGWSQRELANRAKPCSRSYISQVETGKRDPTWTWVCSMLQTLGVLMVLTMQELSSENGKLTPYDVKRLIFGIQTIGDVSNGRQEAATNGRNHDRAPRPLRA